MTGALAELGLITAAWLSFAAATSLAVGAAWRLGAARLRALHPRSRSVIAWLAAAAPSLLPTLLVLACLAPGLLGLLGGAGDHCLDHGGHPHLCVVHLTAGLGAPLAALLVPGGVALAAVLVRGGLRLARERRLLAALGAAAGRAAGPALRVVPSRRPFSFASGLLRGEVWLASSLVEALSSEELAVVLEHERAHLARRDPLRRATAAALSWPLWPGVRRELLAELALASERACDETAAERVGDRLRVAEVILAVERLLGSPSPRTPTAWPAFGGAHLRARVQGLLDEPRAAELPAAAPWAAGVLLLAALALAADPLHHATEHWVRLFLGGG